MNRASVKALTSSGANFHQNLSEVVASSVGYPPCMADPAVRPSRARTSGTSAEDAWDAVGEIVQPSHAGEVAEVVKSAAPYASAPLATWLSHALRALEQLARSEQLSRVVPGKKEGPERTEIQASDDLTSDPQ